MTALDRIAESVPEVAEYQRAQTRWENIALPDRDTAIDEGCFVNRAAINALAVLAERLEVAEEKFGAASNFAVDAHEEWQQAEAERDRFRDTLLARHGGEPLALLDELDEARNELAALKAEYAVVSTAAKELCEHVGVEDFDSLETEFDELAALKAQRCWDCRGHQYLSHGGNSYRSDHILACPMFGKLFDADHYCSRYHPREEVTP